MRTLIVSEFVTLDGVMEAPGGETTHPHTNWVEPYFGEELGEYKLEEVLAAGSLLLGRTTYESFAGAWPTYEGEFAEKMNSMPKHVVSSTLRDPAWQPTTVLGGDVAAAVQALKRDDSIRGPILVAGSATLAHTLLAWGLVDELRLQIFPVSIGHGLRVFPDERNRQVWRLADHTVFDNGVQAARFIPR